MNKIAEADDLRIAPFREDAKTYGTRGAGEGDVSRDQEGSMIDANFSGRAVSEETEEQYVQVAQIDVDPAQLENYRAAVRQQIQAAIRKEPGVLALYAVSDKDDPAHVTVFEIYENMAAYRTHLESAHFKKYKTVTETMVKSLMLVRSAPIMLGAKGK